MTISGTNIINVGQQPRGVRLLGQGGAALAFLLRDLHTTNRAAGSVNGTNAEPIGGNRTVTDTQSKLSLSGGQAVYAGGKSSPGFGDPSLWYPSRSRTVGEVLACLFTPTQTDKFFRAGYSTAANGANPDHGISTSTAGALSALIGATAITIGAYPAQNHVAAIALRATGADYFIHGGFYDYPKLLWSNRSRTTATIYPNHQSFDATATVSETAIQDRKWLPTPLASDGFSSWGTTDGLGHPEGGNALGGGGAGLTWTAQAGTWGASGGAASASALSGGIAIATVNTGSRHVRVGVKVTRSGGGGGLILRYYDASNYVYVVHNGTNVQVIKRVGGVETTLINVAATYSAGALLWGWADLNGYTAVYSDVLISAPSVQFNESLTLTDKMGLYTTDTSNTFDGFIVDALGNEGQHVNAPIVQLGLPSTSMYVIGDSKSAGSGDNAFVQGYPRRMNSNSRLFHECYPREGFSGQTASQMAVRIAADLAAVTGTPDYILLNLGANDVVALPAQAIWKADMETIISACLAKWPNTQIYIMRPWRRSYATECNSLATWIGEIVAAHASGVHLGPDERVFLENGDDGVTYTGDGVHPNAAGYQLVATQWRTALGL